MIVFPKFFVIAVLLACATAGAQEPAPVTGMYTPKTPMQSAPMRVEVLDARTFRDIETGDVYRLYGVDACEGDQIANLGRQPWRCGAAATAWLIAVTLNKWVSCNVLREVNSARLARCSSSEHADLAADMLKEGLAICLPEKEGQQVRLYIAAQEQARRAYRGLWSSQFVTPWEYRAKQAASDKRER